MVKQTLLVRLSPTQEQTAQLLSTLEAFNAACNYLAEAAFIRGSANKITLQKDTYFLVRERFGLSSQMAVRAISKACEAFKSARALHRLRVGETHRKNAERAKKGQSPLALPVLTPCVFRPHGAMPYDERIMGWKGLDAVSLLTLAGRIQVPVRMGEYQAARIDRKRGQCDLIFRNGKWLLAVTVDAPEDEPFEPLDVLGVDLGLVQIASDSDGKQYSGGQVLGLRRRHRRLRSRLQAKGTKSAKRLLKRRSRKESRFARTVNHVISKEIVAKAKDTQRAIALEDLSGIRERIRSRKAHRAALSSWSFHQLRAFITYKAMAAGVEVRTVDPRNTSRTCPACGHIDKVNRKSQSLFLCTQCRCTGNADLFAAENIRRAAVNQPYGSVGSPLERAS